VIFTSLHPDFSGLEASRCCFSSPGWLLILAGLLGEVSGVEPAYWQASEILNLIFSFNTY